MTTDKITLLLRAAEQGDLNAKNLFFDSVYDDLCEMAQRLLARENADNTLHPSALVHEVYLRLIQLPSRSEVTDSETNGNASEGQTPWEGNQLFFSAAANAMRQILVDAARRKTRAKRGGGFCRVLIEPDNISAPELTGQLLAISDAMSALESLEPRMAEVVRLRFYAGMTLREVAETMGIGRRTADGYWAYAKAWLTAEMSDTHREQENKAS